MYNCRTSYTHRQSVWPVCSNTSYTQKEYRQICRNISYNIIHTYFLYTYREFHTNISCISWMFLETGPTSRWFTSNVVIMYTYYSQVLRSFFSTLLHARIIKREHRFKCFDFYRVLCTCSTSILPQLTNTNMWNIVNFKFTDCFFLYKIL